MAHSISELRTLSEKQLIEEHDELARSTIVGTNHYLAELARRDQQKTNAELLQHSRAMTRMTIMITVLTLINVLLVLATLFR